MERPASKNYHAWPDFAIFTVKVVQFLNNSDMLVYQLEFGH
jgi:hypothetical protein